MSFFWIWLETLWEKNLQLTLLFLEKLFARENMSGKNVDPEEQ